MMEWTVVRWAVVSRVAVLCVAALIRSAVADYDGAEVEVMEPVATLMGGYVMESLPCGV